MITKRAISLIFHCTLICAISGPLYHLSAKGNKASKKHSSLDSLLQSSDVQARLRKEMKKGNKRGLQNSLQLPLPCEAVGSSDPDDRMRELVWGELVVNEGPTCIESFHDVNSILETSDKRGKLELEPIPEGEQGACPPSCPFVPSPTCPNPTGMEDVCTGALPLGMRPVKKKNRFQQTCGFFCFDPQKDALLIKFDDGSLRSPGTHIDINFLTNASLNPQPVVDLWNNYYQQVDAHVANNLPSLSYGSWLNLFDGYPFETSEVDCTWFPVDFTASLFVHPLMRGNLSQAPFLSAPATGSANDLYFHLVNCEDQSFYSDDVGRFLSYWGLPNGDGPGEVGFTPFVPPRVGRTKMVGFAAQDKAVTTLVGCGQFNELSDRFKAAPRELNVGYASCGDTALKLSIHPRWDSYTATGGAGLDDNGTRYYTAPENSVLKMEPGILCYKLCSSNLGDCFGEMSGDFCGGFVKNPSLVNVLRCDSSVLDCLCNFDLDPVVLTSIVELLQDALDNPTNVADRKVGKRALRSAVDLMPDDVREKAYREIVSKFESRGFTLDA